MRPEALNGAPKKKRPSFGGRKNGRSEPGREDIITRCPWFSFFCDRALSRCCCVRLDFAFILIPRDEAQHSRAPSKCLALRWHEISERFMKDTDAANAWRTQRRCKSGKIEDFMPSGVTPVAINYAIRDPRHRDLPLTAGLSRSFGTANRKQNELTSLLDATPVREVAFAVSSLVTRLAKWRIWANRFGLERPDQLRHGQLERL